MYFLLGFCALFLILCQCGGYVIMPVEVSHDCTTFGANADVKLRHETTQNSDKPAPALDLVTPSKPYKFKLSSKVDKFNSSLLQ